MDQLTKDCIAARKAGLTYGKYIATLPPAPAAVRFPKEQAKGQEKRCMCKVCGKPIPTGSKQRVYCSVECAHAGQNAQKKANYKKYKTKNKI